MGKPTKVEVIDTVDYSDSCILDRSKLDSEFIKIVEETIVELNLKLSDFLNVVNISRYEAHKFQASILRKYDCTWCNENSMRGELRFADYLADLWVDGVSDEDILFNIIAHALNGMLKSILVNKNSLRKLCFDDSFKLEHINKVIDMCRKIITDQFWYHYRITNFSLCDVKIDLQYSYLMGTYNLKELLKVNLCLFIKQYGIVFHEVRYYLSDHQHQTKEQDKLDMDYFSNLNT